VRESVRNVSEETEKGHYDSPEAAACRNILHFEWHVWEICGYQKNTVARSGLSSVEAAPADATLSIGNPALSVQ